MTENCTSCGDKLIYEYGRLICPRGCKEVKQETVAIRYELDPVQFEKLMLRLSRLCDCIDRLARR